MGTLMIYFILATFLLFFSCGTYLVLADILKFPTLARTKAVLNAIKSNRKKTDLFEVFIFKASTVLSEYIKLDEYRKRKLEASLKSANIKLAPETFIARVWVKTFAVSLFIIPALAIFPILSIVVIFLAVAVYFKEIRSAEEALKIKREEIEYELPRFVATVAQNLKATRDVIGILSAYKKSAGENFSKELEITIADMKSGNEETALMRLEARIGSTQLSDVVRGLISVKRGDNGVLYFQMLAHDFKVLELQRLKLIAMKRPGKIRKYSFYMLGCFLMMYLVILGVEIMNAFGKLF